MSTKVIETDVLVVGHGLAGLGAAITAKEENPELKVVTFDKGTAGYSGKADKGGGYVAFIPEGAGEKYLGYHIRNLGDYLNDKDMLRKYAYSTIETMADGQRGMLNLSGGKWAKMLISLFCGRYV